VAARLRPLGDDHVGPSFLELTRVRSRGGGRHQERAGVGPLGWPRMGAAALDIYRASQAADGEWTPLLAGQGAGVIRREQPAAEIVRELVAEAAALGARKGS
jgi:NAD(P)H-dependent flavin oxidoreductase YrpB (nitropropane dioxygenase family)